MFNPQALLLHRQRAQKTFKNHSFLYEHVEKELAERAQETPQHFNSKLILSTEFFERGEFDLIISPLQAHWVTDLPAFLKDIRHSLTPGGLFLGALWGGESLGELRESLLQAELSLRGGASPRVAPMVQPADAPLLLSQAGFSNPVVDVETLTITYPSLISLMKELRGMGETNVMDDRQKHFTPRCLFQEAEILYRRAFGLPTGTLPVTAQILYLTGWGPERASQTLSANSL